MRSQAIGVIATAMVVMTASSVRAARDVDPLVDGFRNPPHAARPQVWWHWMDGNIAAEGARLDLQWLSGLGIGGVQLFEESTGFPQMVPNRLPYMSPAWASALRASVDTAHRLGLDFAITTSPGWSAAGGPWVEPVDAMRKLVWSKTEIVGGRRIRVQLPTPPRVAGPFQDVSLAAVEAGAGAGPVLYGDVAVLAFPSDPESSIAPERIAASAPLTDAVKLRDNAWGQSLDLPYDERDGGAWIAYDLGRKRTIRSVTLGLPALRGFGSPRPPIALIEAGNDGSTYRQVAELLPTGLPVRSAGFAPTTARWVRVRLVRDARPQFIDRLGVAPVLIVPPALQSAPRHYAISEFEVSSASRVSAAEEKAGFATVPDYYATVSPFSIGVDVQSVVDLTMRLRPDGTLDWTPPAGHWTVLRMGWSLTGQRNGPASAEATGLEVNKLDAASVGRYADTYLSMYREALGDSFDGVTGLLSDSIESGPQNWTETLPAEFRARRGYDPRPWLPALAGVVIGDSRRTERFLWDWRQTIAELYADAYYATLAGRARKAGLAYYAEALEDHRPQLGSDLAMRRAADIPMGAMWTPPDDGKPNPTYVADVKGAASIANLYGKPLVAAESLTAFGRPWAFAPSDLKASADLELALGVNRIIIQASAHQPARDAAPGIALSTMLGQYFTRNETWAPMADAWIAYLSRSSFLLQQGRHIADVAVFTGEEAPLTSLYGDRLCDGVPEGYDFDFVDADALKSRLKVNRGDLVTPTGGRYRVLLLAGSSRYITLATLRRLSELVYGGAYLVGARPLGSPSLGDSDRVVTGVINDLWGPPGARTVRAFGAGRVFASTNPAAALAARKTGPDWQWRGPPGAELMVLHRQLADGELYYVVNRRPQSETGMLTLRFAGRAPEGWNPVTGERRAISYRASAAATALPMTLAPGEAIFVIARAPSSQRARTMPKVVFAPLQSLDARWHLSFQPGRGAPETARSATIGSWTDDPDPGVRYFSGVATYRQTLNLTALQIGARDLFLDLGRVGDVAEVYINGKRAGVAWTAPYRVRVTGLLMPGQNDIEIRVANLWVNRLVGDAQPGARKIAVTTGPTYGASAPLRRSGLLGPVRLVAASAAPNRSSK